MCVCVPQFHATCGDPLSYRGAALQGHLQVPEVFCGRVWACWRIVLSLVPRVHCLFKRVSRLRASVLWPRRQCELCGPGRHLGGLGGDESACTPAWCFCDFLPGSFTSAAGYSSCRTCPTGVPISDQPRFNGSKHVHASPWAILLHFRRFQAASQRRPEHPSAHLQLTRPFRPCLSCLDWKCRGAKSAQVELLLTPPGQVLLSSKHARTLAFQYRSTTLGLWCLWAGHHQPPGRDPMWEVRGLCADRRSTERGTDSISSLLLLLLLLCWTGVPSASTSQLLASQAASRHVTVTTVVVSQGQQSKVGAGVFMTAAWYWSQLAIDCRARCIYMSWGARRAVSMDMNAGLRPIAMKQVEDSRGQALQDHDGSSSAVPEPQGWHVTWTWTPREWNSRGREPPRLPMQRATSWFATSVRRP